MKVRLLLEFSSSWLSFEKNFSFNSPVTGNGIIIGRGLANKLNLSEGDPVSFLSQSDDQQGLSFSEKPFLKLLISPFTSKVNGLSLRFKDWKALQQFNRLSCQIKQLIMLLGQSSN